MIRRITYTLLLAGLTLNCGGTTSDNVTMTVWTPDSVVFKSYPFVDISRDSLYDPAGAIIPFFTKLERLDSLLLSRNDTSSADLQRINIIHFGDSHVQAGSLTGTVMRQFHHRFGNAGRGMVVPHRISGTNEPRDYAIRTAASREWTTGKVIQSRCPLPLGISGVAVESPKPENRITLHTFSTDDSLNYRFNRVRVFHGPYAPIIEADKKLSADISSPDLIYDFNTDIDLIEPVDSVDLVTYSDGRFARGPFFGFSLENGRDGVLYHALGVNGACYVHWARNSEVARQTTALEPDLFILSMGSNEASGSNFNESVFYNEVDRFVNSLRKENPQTPIILTAPVQAFRKGNPNVNYKYVSRVLRRYAEEKGTGFIDLYHAGGGDGSARLWDQQKLMGRDRIHFTEEGYQLQGMLIYHAIYQAYNEHLWSQTYQN